MTKTISKLFWVWQHGQEEQWLDEMSRQGWQLQKVKLFRYTFVKDDTARYLHQLQFLPASPQAKESKSYLEFLEGTGVEVIDAPSNWVYLRRPVAQGAFEIYSDSDSRLAHVKRIFAIFVPLAMGNTMAAITTTLVALRNPNWFLIFAAGLAGGVALFLWYGMARLWNMMEQLKKQQQLEAESKGVF